MCYSHVLCYSSWMKLHHDCVIRTRLIQHLDSKNTLKIRWQWALLFHPHPVVQVCDGLLHYRRLESINSWQDHPLSCSVSRTTLSLPQMHILNARAISHIGDAPLLFKDLLFPDFPVWSWIYAPWAAAYGPKCCLAAAIHRPSPLTWYLVQTHICNVERCVGIADIWKVHVLLLVQCFWFKRSVWGRWTCLELLG